jgi:glycerol-3-phosphate dehydrogenase (NAD(P)+)
MTLTGIGVVGAGAWGSALAETLTLAGRTVTLWARRPEIADEIANQRTNATYLPGARLSQGIAVTTDLAQVARADAVLFVVPAQETRRIAGEIGSALTPGTPVVLCAKGIERATGLALSHIVQEALPRHPIAVLSGPSFAADVVRGLPAAVTLGCRDESLGAALAAALGYRHFRIYWTSDVVGVELGGAAKNVLAIAAGIVEGRGLGASAHAALVTRGFAELCRLGAALGARPETLMGLSGLGDLILTCGSMQSRNFSLGQALGRGTPLETILAGRKSVSEGVATASALCRVAADKGIEMPISAAVSAVVGGQISVDDAIAGLLTRPFRPEA